MRIYARKYKVHYLQADDYLILAALVKPQTPSVACALLKLPFKVFSTALVVTNILGAAIGGFGVPFSSLSDDEAVLFLKVRAKTLPLPKLL